jgi:uncharacterized protein (TIGR03000 family)
MSVIGLSLASESAFAEQGWPLQQNYGRPVYSQRVPYRATPSYTANYAPAAAPARAANVQIDLRVPTGAKVWFDGAATTQTGTSRTFVSAPLTPGSQYSYTVRVQWSVDGQVIERTRDISFMAGDHVQLDFTPTMQTASR